MSANRRDFIKFVVAGAVTAGCPIDLSLVAQTQTGGSKKGHAADVSGEDNQVCHQVRNEGSSFFKRPPASARHDVVIVGGGVSGLAAAYRLQHCDFLLLEKEPHWGGNAYAAEYEGSTYATGSAFLTKDEYAYEFAKEIGLEPLPINSPDASVIRGEVVPDTWGDGLDKLPYPAPVRDGFKKFKKELLAIDVAKTKGIYDKPFSDFMKGHPAEIKQWWDCFGPSNWGATSEETTAGLGIINLQEMVEESGVDDRYTWPGGLGALTKKLADILRPKYKDRMQTGATIVAVVSEKEEVHITYMLGGELKTVAAKAVIMATPKFITRRIVASLPDKQSEAMKTIRYIPYPVVNLIFDKPVFNYGFDTWCPGNSFTDIAVADWVIQKQAGYRQKFNILTCYTPMKEEDRGYLLNETGARKIAANVLADFQKLLPGSNVDPVEVHIYRRGHPLYMSTPGLFTQVQPVARHPMDRVFFANTDSEGPESTTNGGILAAQRAVKQVEARLAGKPMPKETAVAG
jgi:protoporphyrinogen oxidase